MNWLCGKIEGLYRSIRDWAKEKAEKDGPLSSLILVAYKWCSSELFDCLLGLLNGIPIAVLLEKDVNAPIVKILLCIWGVGSLASVCAKHYVKEKSEGVSDLRKKLQIYEKGCREITSTLRGWSIETRRVRKKLRKTSQIAKAKENWEKIKDLNVQAAAIMICENFRRALDIDESDEKIRVRIYEKTNKRNGEVVCKIAATTNDSDPLVYVTESGIPQNQLAKKGEDDYHVYLFSKNQTQIEVLHGRQSIESVLGAKEKTMTYESNIQQSIAVPVAVGEKGVTLLIRMDSTIPDRFGKDEEALKAFAKAVVYPYGQFLMMVYEQWSIFEKVAK